MFFIIQMLNLIHNRYNLSLKNNIITNKFELFVQQQFKFTQHVHAEQKIMQNMLSVPANSETFVFYIIVVIFLPF